MAIGGLVVAGLVAGGVAVMWAGSSDTYELAGATATGNSASLLQGAETAANGDAAAAAATGKAACFYVEPLTWWQVLRWTSCAGRSTSRRPASRG